MLFNSFFIINNKKHFVVSDLELLNILNKFAEHKGIEHVSDGTLNRDDISENSFLSHAYESDEKGMINCFFVLLTNDNLAISVKIPVLIEAFMYFPVVDAELNDYGIVKNHLDLGKNKSKYDSFYV